MNGGIGVAVAVLLLIVVLAWISLGWMALLVLPFTALFALLALTPELLRWGQDQI